MASLKSLSGGQPLITLKKRKETYLYLKIKLLKLKQKSYLRAGSSRLEADQNNSADRQEEAAAPSTDLSIPIYIHRGKCMPGVSGCQLANY